MKKYPYLPQLVTTSALLTCLLSVAPAWAETAEEKTPSVPRATVSKQTLKRQQAEAAANPAKAEGDLRTIQLQVPRNSRVTVEILPDGTEIVTTHPALPDYHKQWPKTKAPSFLTVPWPSIPADFASRKQLGVIEVQGSHLASSVKLDPALAGDERLVLKRTEVLSSRLINKLSLDAQQQIMATPELALHSRYTPTFFNTKQLLILRPQEEGVYSALLVNLATLKTRVLFAPPTKKAIEAHTYLVQQALLPRAEAQQEVVADKDGKYYHCLGAVDLNSENAGSVFANAVAAENANLTNCPNCFTVNTDASASAPAPEEAAADAQNNSATAATTTDSEVKLPVEAAANDTKANSAPEATANNAEGQRLTEAADNNAEVNGTTKVIAVTPPKHVALQQRHSRHRISAREMEAPLVARHLHDRCFSQTYRNLLRANDIADVNCPAYILDDEDFCAFPYFANGPIYVTTGLYRQLDTPGELTAALAHELAYVILGYVDDKRAKRFDDHNRPWILTRATREYLQELALWRSAYTYATMSASLAWRHMYWGYTPPVSSLDTNLANYAYYENDAEQSVKADRLAAVMSYVAGYSPSEYRTYLEKVSALAKTDKLKKNGDINLWLWGSDFNRLKAVEPALKQLEKLDVKVQEIAKRDPAMAQSLRAQAGLSITDADSLQKFIAAYQAIIPAE